MKMSKYSVTGIIDASVGCDVEAETPLEAAEAAYDVLDAPGLCHHCARDVDLGDLVSLIIFDEGGNEVFNDDYLDEQNKRLKEQNKKLVEALKAIDEADYHSPDMIRQIAEDALKELDQ